MVTSVTLTATGTWTVPGDCPAGTVLDVQAWAAGAGAGGRTTNGAGGAGGAFAESNYTVTPGDVISGIPYVIGTGSAGTGAANSTAGGNTIWSNNNLNLIPVSIDASEWFSTFQSGSGLSSTPVYAGLLNGYPAVDIPITGTATPGDLFDINMSFAQLPVTPGLVYTLSLFVMLIGGSMATNTSLLLNSDVYDGSANQINTISSAEIVPTSTPVRITSTGTADPTAALFAPYIQTIWSGGAVNCTLRVFGWQLKQESVVSAWQSTPGYTLAPGGAGTTGTAGGVGSTTGSIWTNQANAGGSGAARSATGSGGGGSGGPDGSGLNGTTAGVGGQGDGTFGGLGGAVKATSPGNPGTANASGGGGGGGTTATGSSVGGVGGIPGGGGGASVGATGTGGAGARGQIVVSYTPTGTSSSPFGRNPMIQVMAG